MSVQGTDQPREGQRERSHGPGGEQERSEHPHRGVAAGSGAGPRLRHSLRGDLSQNTTGNQSKSIIHIGVFTVDKTIRSQHMVADRFFETMS